MSIPKRFKSVILGDLNATIGHKSYGHWSSLGPTNNINMATNDNGIRLLSFADQNRYRIENTIRPSKQRLIHTWRSGTGFEKRIDYVLTSKFLQKYVTKCRVRRGSSNLFETDHYLLETALYLPSKRQLRKNNVQKLLNNTRNIGELAQKEVQANYCIYLDTFLAHEPSNDIELVNNVIIDSTTEAIEKVCNINPQICKSKPWKDVILRDLMKSQWKIQDRKKLCDIRKQIKHRPTILINKYYEGKAHSINKAHEAREVSNEFALAKKFSMHQKSSKMIISKEKLHNHFKSHFNLDNIEIPPELDEPESSCLKNCLNEASSVDETPPTSDEMTDTLRKLKNGKCKGIDQMHMEALKYATSSPRLILFLVTLLQLIWTSITPPVIWTQSQISCLFKKYSRSDPANYRGISVTATLSRIMPMIIMKRLQDAYNNMLDQSQYGFRSNTGCDDAIFIVCNIIEKSSETMYLVFIDLTAAYDKIPRPLLFRVMDIRLGCKHLVSLIQSIYTETTAKIKGSKNWFKVTSGCRQGGVESPFLFNIYMDTVCRVIEYELSTKLGDSYGIKCRYQIPNESSNREQRYEHPLYGWAYIKKVLYADDMVMFFKTKEALQEGLDIIESVLSRYGLTLSRKKTETMVVNGSPDETIQESIVHVGDYKIKNVSEFCYLGVLISSVNPSRVVEHRIASASAKFAELKHMLQDQRINLKTRSLYMNAFIRSRLTYNTSTWLKCDSFIAKLEVVWVRMLRRILKGGFRRKNSPPSELPREEIEKDQWDYSFVYSNTDIYRITGTESIQNYIEKQNFTWLAHCSRMSNNMIQKQIMFMIPSRKHYRDYWVPLENRSGMDKCQLRMTMFDKKLFNSWVYQRYHH